ncbi:GIY-YIG nuclease family protein [uncultured Mameliella sp.]|uniref:GIY-YIG nuclease family protein n=1 Tax=uncultured Mameliella sp. TaxID=1447087 RepID=UPI0026267BD8|nr:GIY-YIG nuclease family protein [uncultured Mameliella sp.]
MISGRSLELFFVDGRPEGMLTAEVFNWTGHVLRVPRTRLVDGLKRSIAAQTGVYILLGQDDQGPLAYIGEAEVMSDRIKQHATQKDWWEQVILITTAGDALHKAHVKYLESRLAEMALDANQTRLENGNAPPRSSLNEAATANMESFLETLQMVLPAIRVDLLQSGKRPETKKTEVVEKTQPLEFFFEVPRHGVKAKARLEGDEMVVLAGSQIRASWIGDRKYHSTHWELHDELVSRGIIRSEGGKVGTLTEDYAFSSPSAAAAFAAGRSANGRTSWKLADGRSYAEWETEQLSGQQE